MPTQLSFLIGAKREVSLMLKHSQGPFGYKMYSVVLGHLIGRVSPYYLRGTFVDP